MMKRWFDLTVFCLAVVILLTACKNSGESRTYPLGNRITNCDEIVLGLRNGLKGHAASITVTFDYGSDIYDELNTVIEDWMSAALEETGDPAEGDYIRYQYGGYDYTSSYVIADDRYQYTIKIVPDYYDSLSQEREAAEAAEMALKTLDIPKNAPDAEKIEVVYRFLCDHVGYDKINRKNRLYHLKSTAYAALVQHNATCQGYCTAMYRLLRSLGVPCRIITGTATGPGGEPVLHAWLIVGIDGIYYQLDPTWDAGKETFDCFLRGTDGFDDHTPGEYFTTQTFREAYPLSESDYRE